MSDSAVQILNGRTDRIFHGLSMHRCVGSLYSIGIPTTKKKSCSEVVQDSLPVDGGSDGKLKHPVPMRSERSESSRPHMIEYLPMQ